MRNNTALYPVHTNALLYLIQLIIGLIFFCIAPPNKCKLTYNIQLQKYNCYGRETTYYAKNYLYWWWQYG